MKPKRDSRPPVRRRDALGHINPAYGRDLLALSGHSDGDDQGRAFLEGPYTDDELSEELGEAFVASATSGEEAEPERQDRVTPDEEGGPFIVSSARREFGLDADESNPTDSSKEPFPRAVGGDTL